MSPGFGHARRLVAGCAVAAEYQNASPAFIRAAVARQDLEDPRVARFRILGLHAGKVNAGGDYWHANWRASVSSEREIGDGLRDLHIVMVYVIMAYTVMAYIVMAYILMASTIMS